VAAHSTLAGPVVIVFNGPCRWTIALPLTGDCCCCCRLTQNPQFYYFQTLSYSTFSTHVIWLDERAVDGGWLNTLSQNDSSSSALHAHNKLEIQVPIYYSRQSRSPSRLQLYPISRLIISHKGNFSAYYVRQNISECNLKIDTDASSSVSSA
jgi:hypothetical protein